MGIDSDKVPTIYTITDLKQLKLLHLNLGTLT